jgi:hypothetical protein
LFLVGCAGVAGDQTGGGGGLSGGEDGSAGACLAGATECSDTGASSDGDSAAMCAEGATDCDDTPVSDDPCPPEGCRGDEQPAARRVQPAGQRGLHDVHPISWDEHVAKGRRLTVRWWSGVEPCHVLASVDVVETRRKVTVTLFEGSGDPDAACIEIAERLRTTVRLQRPLGDRTVVDGSQR